MSAIRVRKFDPSTIKESRILFIIGKRHTGKSVLMKDLLYHMPRPDNVLAMAPTEDSTWRCLGSSKVRRDGEKKKRGR